MIASLLVLCGACARDSRRVVEISGFEFRPRVLEARVGDTIVFVNRDVVPHTAIAPDAAWDSGVLAANASWSWIALERGAVDYTCALHSAMAGTIEVR